MIESAINSLSQQSTSDKNNNKAVLTTAYDGAFRFTYNSAPKYFFTFIGSDKNAVYEVKKGNEIISKLTHPNDIIDTSIITSYNIDIATNLSGYAYDVASQSNGMIIRGWNCSTTLVNHIYKENTNPNVILMGGMKQLPSNFGPLSATSTRDYDDDGLKDTEEINFEASYKGGYNLIYFEDDGTVILPTYNECMTFFKDDKFYIEKGLERFQNSSEYLTFNGDTTYVLPIKSDPTNVDGDKDGILDRYDGYKLAYNEIPDLFIGLVNEEYMSFEDLAFAGCDGDMICCVSLSKLFSRIPISKLKYNGLISTESIQTISEELENQYLISYNDGEKEYYHTFYCDNMSYIKKLKFETEAVEAFEYSKIDWDKINEEYPEYELTKKAAEYAKIWLQSVAETDEMYLAKINQACDNTPTPMSVAYMLSGNENIGAVDEWYKGIKKGFIGAAYNLVSSVTKVTATLIILDQQAIEYDYYYRQTYYKEHGEMPKKYSMSSSLSFIANGAKKSIIYTLDDYDTRVLQGDLESQGMYLGEYLFDVALDLATGGLASKADEAVECGEDTAKIATKQIMLDETKDAISKAKGENWLDLIKGTGELADTGVYFNIGNLDGIDNINDILPRVGLTKDEFNSLRLKDISTLSDQEKKLMRVIRENIPNPTSDTMLQKLIPYQDIEKYMDGNYGQIRGFVAKVDDVASLKTYNEIYNGLGLEYPGSTFNPDIDTSLGVIRFETNAVSQLEIPFGTAMEGKENGAYPFIGNGYAIAPDGQIIPEYKFGNFVDLKNGAQLIQVKKDGTEILLAVYDESKGKFVSLN